MTDFTKEQADHARLAETLREMIHYVQDINLGEVAPGIPAIWPADNIRDVLGRAADLIETLTLARRAP